MQNADVYIYKYQCRCNLLACNKKTCTIRLGTFADAHKNIENVITIICLPVRKFCVERILRQRDAVEVTAQQTKEDAFLMCVPCRLRDQYNRVRVCQLK